MEMDMQLRTVKSLITRRTILSACNHTEPGVHQSVANTLQQRARLRADGLPSSVQTFQFLTEREV